MKYCQYCGTKTEENKFCSNCGKPNKFINKKDYKLIIFASISLLLGVICFIPQIYLSQNYYKIAGAYAAVEFGDYSELNKLKTLEAISGVGTFVGIAFCIVCVLLVGFHILNKYKKSKENEKL